MKEILSITELARLRNVTTETLRHYDRIGLLKPYKINEVTRERYYSIYQYEQLGTIKELRQLGFTLKEIQNYLENRNIKTTNELLIKSLDVVEEKLKELAKLKTMIEFKLDFIEQIKDLEINYQIETKQIDYDRFYLMSERKISNEVELSYEAINLETIISKNEPYIPIFASNRYVGFYTDYQSATNNPPRLGIQIANTSNEFSELKKVSKGHYLTIMFSGDFWEGKNYINKLLDYARKKGLLLDNEILQTQWLDYTFVNSEDELIYEVQVRLI